MTNYLLFLAITFSVCLKVINCDHCGFIDPEEVNLVLYKEAIESVSLNNVDKILNHEFFYPEREIVIFAFDFLENISSPSVQEISESFLEQGSYNFLVLDYGKFSGGNYFFDALPNAVKIGQLFGNILVDLSNANKLNVSKITLVGYSLGAHVMGEVGRTVQKLSSNSLRIPNIVGLDPAGPAFYPLNPYVVALSKNDADFVQIIHTDTENFGIPIATGHVDFWPNGGQSQPGCKKFDNGDIFKAENFCSHLRSVDYYAESILNGNSFGAVECDSWIHFQNNNCIGHKSNVLNHLGPKADRKLYRNFYLTTNSQPTYAKGFDGIFNFAQ